MADILPEDAVARIRRPQQIFTDAYLNDPIRFTPDIRFEPETVLRQLYSGSIVSRDPSDYAVVNINAKTAINYPMPMTSQVYRRADIERAIDQTFRYFV